MSSLQRNLKRCKVEHHRRRSYVLFSPASLEREHELDGCILLAYVNVGQLKNQASDAFRFPIYRSASFYIQSYFRYIRGRLRSSRDIPRCSTNPLRSPLDPEECLSICPHPSARNYSIAIFSNALVFYTVAVTVAETPLQLFLQYLEVILQIQDTAGLNFPGFHRAPPARSLLSV
jgi:hypothetical protein